MIEYVGDTLIKLPSDSSDSMIHQSLFPSLAELLKEFNIPPLIIVIGVPNAVFLINKYQQEIKSHGQQAKALQRVISKIGNATLMTNITTASGFATFVFVKSQLLREFGILASINILSIFNF